METIQERDGRLGGRFGREIDNTHRCSLASRSVGCRFGVFAASFGSGSELSLS